VFICLDITYDRFERFEYEEGHEEVDGFYIPTAESLEAVNGEDSY